MCNFIGRRCECEFEIGDEIVTRSGILRNINSDSIVLCSNNNQNTILFCNKCALRFIRFD